MSRVNMAAVTVSPTIRFDIFIAGDVETAKAICRKHCFDVGLCVTVEGVSYIYTGGEEAGVRVGLINYPRFPTTKSALRLKAHALGRDLMEGLHQLSFSIVGPDQTEWISRRQEDVMKISPKPETVELLRDKPTA